MDISFSSVVVPDSARLSEVADALLEEETSEQAPRLAWHPRIRSALALIQSYIDRFDALWPYVAIKDELKAYDRISFRERTRERCEEVFKTASCMQMGVVRLVELLDETFHFHASSFGADRVRVKRLFSGALSTYSKLASLQVIGAIHFTEGAVAMSDGRTIERFFEDMPFLAGVPMVTPHSDLYLLRHPHYCPIGALYFNTGDLALVRLREAKSAQYEAILLPYSTAEHLRATKEMVGLSLDTYFRWILPQWALRQHDGSPFFRSVSLVYEIDEPRNVYPAVTEPNSLPDAMSPLPIEDVPIPMEKVWVSKCLRVWATRPHEEFADAALQTDEGAETVARSADFIVDPDAPEDELSQVLRPLLDRLDEITKIQLELSSTLSHLRDKDLQGKTIREIRDMLEDLWLKETSQELKTAVQKISSSGIINEIVRNPLLAAILEDYFSE